MSDVIDTFRVQFDAMITEIKKDLCRDVDAKANALYGLLQEELRRQMQSTGNHVVAENDENNRNTGDDTVLGHVKVEDESIKSECECDTESEWDTDTDEDIEVMIEESEDDDDQGERDADENDNENMAVNDENNGNAGNDTVSGHVKVEEDSIKSECECDTESERDTASDTDEDIEVVIEEPEDDDNGDHDAVNDNESMGDGEDDLIETNQAMFDEEDAVTNAVDGNESVVDQDDGNGDEQTEDAVNGNNALGNQSAPVPNEPMLQVASTSGLRRSNRTSIKRQQIISDDVTSSDEEDAGSDRSQAGPKRKRARVNSPPAARDRPHQETTVDQENSKNVITISLNCTVTGCAQNFCDKTQLIEHLKRKHNIDRYRCHVRGCTLSFTTSPKLTEHHRSAHGSLTRWPCGHCVKQCASFHHLVTHVFQYHELGRFVCGHVSCDFPASTYRKKVMSHQRQHKPATHQCTFAGCGMSFKQSDNLKKHTRTHTGERPFICDQCQKAFNRKHSLTRHVHTQH